MALTCYPTYVKALNNTLRQQRTTAHERAHAHDMNTPATKETTEESASYTSLPLSTDYPTFIPTGPSRNHDRVWDDSVGVESVRRLQKEERKLEEMRGRHFAKLLAFQSMKCFHELTSRLGDGELTELLSSPPRV